MSGLDDLDRLFHRLVQVLAERGPERVAQPIQVAELYQDLVPYRQHRLALKLETHQDYEMALLRLVAGERDYARVEPEEAQQAFVMEVQAALPDAGVIHEFAAARVLLNAAAARKALAGGEAYAPETLHPPTTPTAPAGRADRADEAGGAERAGRAADAEPMEALGDACPFCDAELPQGRVLFYCPFCGGNLKGVKCPGCGTELEVGWLYCITCGRKMGGE
jgi:hypothetical protein